MIRKNAFIFILLLVNITCAKAQTDSLLLNFHKINNTNLRLDAAFDIAKKYVSTSPDTAIKYLGIALADSAKAENKASVGNCLNGLSVAYFYLANAELSGKYALQAIHVFKQINDAEGLNKARKNYALSLETIGKFEEAIGIYFETLNFFMANMDTMRITGTLNDIGNIYIKTKNYTQALYYQHKALGFLQGNEISTQTKGNTLNSIGFIYDDMSLKDSAIYYYKQALAIKKKGGGRVKELMTTVG